MLYAQTIVIMLVFAVDLTSTIDPQNDGVSVTSVTMESAVLTSQHCVTGKSRVGTCVKRERCDYGTATIDFTLYRPRGFKLSCPSKEDVCCPPYLIVQRDDRVWVPENEGFNFEDDD